MDDAQRKDNPSDGWDEAASRFFVRKLVRPRRFRPGPPRVSIDAEPYLAIPQIVSDPSWLGEGPDANDLLTWCLLGLIKSVGEGADTWIPSSEMDRIRSLHDEWNP